MSRRKSLKLKLKELCTKIRFWLIKKLGGCIAEYNVALYETIDSMVLVAETTVRDADIFSGRFDLNTYIEALIKESLVPEIVEKELYELLWSDSYEFDRKVLRVRMRVVPPAKEIVGANKEIKKWIRR